MEANLSETPIYDCFAMQIAPVATLCLERLAAMLLQVCQNPTQPVFNHYLFESVAALIKYSAAAELGKVDELESKLFPAFDIVLQQDVQV
jgi:exportin-2 (importin alpha re-exporter)